MGCNNGDSREKAEEVQPPNLLQEQNLKEGLKTEVRDKAWAGGKKMGQKA